MALRPKPATGNALVLLVDPNRNGLSARSLLLQEIGCQMLTATSEDDGLQLLHDLPFNLVITAHEPPLFDGLNLVKSLRRSGSQTPVILISGLAETLGLDKKSTGADVVLQKSANEVHHLQRAVVRLLSRKPVRKPAGAVTAAKTGKTGAASA